MATASLLIAANSHAKEDEEPSPAAVDHSVPLPPQPEPPPGIESNAPPIELDSLPPPPTPPPGARARPTRQRTAAVPHERDIPPALPEKDPQSGGKWYGAQTLAIDGTALTMAAVGFHGEEGFLTGVGVIGFLLATPIVHGSHGKGGRGWGSFGLRLALPAGGAIISGDNPVVGAFFGAMGASVIDALRAYDDPERMPSRTTRHTVLLSPIVGRKSAGLTFAGSF